MHSLGKFLTPETSNSLNRLFRTAKLGHAFFWTLGTQKCTRWTQSPTWRSLRVQGAQQRVSGTVKDGRKAARKQGRSVMCKNIQARLQRGVVSHLDQEGSNNWPGGVSNSNNPNISSLQSLTVYSGFPGGSAVKNQLANAEDVSLIPGWGRSPEEGNGHPL